MTPDLIATGRRPRYRMTADLKRRHAAALARLQDVERDIVARTTLIPQAQELAAHEHRPLVAHIDDYCRITSRPDQVRRALLKLNNFIGQRALCQARIEEFLLELRSADFSANYKSTIAAYVKGFLDWLQDTDRTKERFRLKGIMPKKPVQEPRAAMTRDDVDRLMLAAGDHPIGWLVLLGWHTGMAIKDCCLLLWKEVDLEGCCIRRRRSKTTVEAVIPFEVGGELHSALQTKRMEAAKAGAAAPGDPVCPASALRADAMSVHFAHLRRVAGVDPAKSFHSLRSAMVSSLVREGVHPTLAMRVTGHKSVEVFSRYATVDLGQLRAVVSSVR
jgi:integrase